MSRRPIGATRTTTSKGDRIIEILAVVLLGIATIGTAWCGYQASRWNGREGDLTRDAAIVQTEAARLFGLATQTVSYDSNILAQYAQAASAGDQRLMDFYRQSLVRPAMLPLLDQWEEQVRAGETPTNLLLDKGYLATQLTPYEDEVAKAGSIVVDSGEAGDHADAYVLTTLLLAAALFFSGLTTSFRVRLARVMLLGAASLTIAYTAGRLIDLPVA